MQIEEQKNIVKWALKNAVAHCLAMSEEMRGGDTVFDYMADYLLGQGITCYNVEDFSIEAETSDLLAKVQVYERFIVDLFNYFTLAYRKALNNREEFNPDLLPEATGRAYEIYLRSEGYLESCNDFRRLLLRRLPKELRYFKLNLGDVELPSEMDETQQLLVEILEFLKESKKTTDRDRALIDRELDRGGSGDVLEWDIKNTTEDGIYCTMLRLFGDRIEQLLKA